jgi:sec-independent protein translocase protein TatA
MILFLDISGGELLLIMFFFLMFFGAKSIPNAAKTLGKAMRQMKDATNEIQKDITNSVDEVKEEINENRKRLDQ